MILQDIRELNKQAGTLDMPEDHASDAQKVGAVLGLWRALAKLIKTLWPKSSKAIDIITGVIEAVAGGAVIIRGNRD